ncbi:hypothetical protein AAFF_G00306900 [Aldrovandia affinis]|uniref:Uncharacterized protein n=1 Tax=Aldrovandia affinis TaxID=143900 RepID=A0AAD7R7Y3_9TELE|nr:hypothetical protein AAFF_G00306900 [Aldrovandia affinis]
MAPITTIFYKESITSWVLKKFNFVLDGDDQNGGRRGGGVGRVGGPKVSYVPPLPPEEENSIFAHYQTGINFDKYKEILVDVSGSNAPQAIMTFEEASLCETLSRNVRICETHTSPQHPHHSGTGPDCMHTDRIWENGCLPAAHLAAANG